MSQDRHEKTKYYLPLLYNIIGIRAWKPSTFQQIHNFCFPTSPINQWLINVNVTNKIRYKPSKVATKHMQQPQLRNMFPVQKVFILLQPNCSAQVYFFLINLHKENSVTYAGGKVKHNTNLIRNIWRVIISWNTKNSRNQLICY